MAGKIHGGTIQAELTADVSGYMSGLGQATQASQQFQRSVTGISFQGFNRGIIATTTLLYGMNRIMSQMSQGMEEFSNVLARIGSVADLTAESVRNLADSMKSVSVSQGVVRSDIMKAMYTTAQSRFTKPSEMRFFGEQSAMLSRASGKEIDAMGAAKLMTGLVRSLGLDVQKDVASGKLSDMLLKSRDIGRWELREMAPAIAKVATVFGNEFADRLGGIETLRQMNAIMAVASGTDLPLGMVSTGVRRLVERSYQLRGSGRGDYLRSQLSSLGYDSKDPITAALEKGPLFYLRDLAKLSGGSPMELYKLGFQSRELAAVSAAMSGKGSQLMSAYQQMAPGGISGLTGQYSDKMKNTYEFRRDQLRAEWQITAQEFMQASIPLIGSFTTALSGLNKVAQMLPDSVKSFMGLIAMVTSLRFALNLLGFKGSIFGISSNRMTGGGDRGKLGGKSMTSKAGAASMMSQATEGPQNIQQDIFKKTEANIHRIGDARFGNTSMSEQINGPLLGPPSISDHYSYLRGRTGDFLRGRISSIGRSAHSFGEAIGDTYRSGRAWFGARHQDYRLAKAYAATIASEKAHNISAKARGGWDAINQGLRHTSGMFGRGIRSIGQGTLGMYGSTKDFLGSLMGSRSVSDVSGGSMSGFGGWLGRRGFDFRLAKAYADTVISEKANRISAKMHSGWNSLNQGIGRGLDLYNTARQNLGDFIGRGMTAGNQYARNIYTSLGGLASRGYGRASQMVRNRMTDIGERTTSVINSIMGERTRSPISGGSMSGLGGWLGRRAFDARLLGAFSGTIASEKYNVASDYLGKKYKDVLSGMRHGGSKLGDIYGGIRHGAGVATDALGRIYSTVSGRISDFGSRVAPGMMRGLSQTAGVAAGWFGNRGRAFGSSIRNMYEWNRAGIDAASSSVYGGAKNAMGWLGGMGRSARSIMAEGIGNFARILGGATSTVGRFASGLGGLIAPMAKMMVVMHGLNSFISGMTSKGKNQKISGLEKISPDRYSWAGKLWDWFGAASKHTGAAWVNDKETMYSSLTDHARKYGYIIDPDSPDALGAWGAFWKFRSPELKGLRQAKTSDVLSEVWREELSDAQRSSLINYGGVNPSMFDEKTKSILDKHLRDLGLQAPDSWDDMLKGVDGIDRVRAYLADAYKKFAEELMSGERTEFKGLGVRDALGDIIRGGRLTKEQRRGIYTSGFLRAGRLDESMLGSYAEKWMGRTGVAGDIQYKDGAWRSPTGNKEDYARMSRVIAGAIDMLLRDKGISAKDDTWGVPGGTMDMGSKTFAQTLDDIAPHNIGRINRSIRDMMLGERQMSIYGLRDKVYGGGGGLNWSQKYKDLYGEAISDVHRNFGGFGATKESMARLVTESRNLPKLVAEESHFVTDTSDVVKDTLGRITDRRHPQYEKMHRLSNFLSFIPNLATMGDKEAEDAFLLSTGRRKGKDDYYETDLDAFRKMDVSSFLDVVTKGSGKLAAATTFGTSEGYNQIVGQGHGPEEKMVANLDRIAEALDRFTVEQSDVDKEREGLFEKVKTFLEKQWADYIAAGTQFFAQEIDEQ